MTNRIVPNAKSLFAAALAASALLGLSACGSSAAKPAAAAAVAGAAGAATSATTPAAVPNTPQAPGTPAATSTAQSKAAGDTSNLSDKPSQSRDDSQTDAPAQPPTTAKPAAKPSTGASSSNGSGNSSDPTLPSACPVGHLKGTVTKLNRPINHVLLTVTNTGSSTCDVYYYPDLKLDADQQSTTQVVQDSQPQAVVTLDPGASAYAAIGTSAADGSGGTPKLEKQVVVYLQTIDQSGSLPGSLTLPLPAGTYVDDKAFVTFWQSDLQSATAW